MKEKPPRRTSKAAREAAERDLAVLLPTLESVTAEPEEKQAAMKRTADRARVEKTMAYTVDRVTREIGDLQLSISQMLTDLSQQLRKESGKLAEVRLAIDSEHARLKELHDIDAVMISLKAILEVGAERRAAVIQYHPLRRSPAGESRQPVIESGAGHKPHHNVTQGHENHIGCGVCEDGRNTSCEYHPLGIHRRDEIISRWTDDCRGNQA